MSSRVIPAAEASTAATAANYRCDLCALPLIVSFSSISRDASRDADFVEQPASVSILPCNHCFHTVCLEEDEAKRWKEEDDGEVSSPGELRCPVFDGPALACAGYQEARREMERQHQHQRRIYTLEKGGKGKKSKKKRKRGDEEETRKGKRRVA